MNSKFYTSVAKGLKLKVRKFWGLAPMFGEVTEEKLLGSSFCWHLVTPHHILNRVKIKLYGKITCSQLHIVFSLCLIAEAKFGENLKVPITKTPVSSPKKAGKMLSLSKDLWLLFHFVNNVLITASGLRKIFPETVIISLNF